MSDGVQPDSVLAWILGPDVVRQPAPVPVTPPLVMYPLTPWVPSVGPGPPPRASQPSVPPFLPTIPGQNAIVSSIEHAPVKVPFFTVLGTYLGIGVKKTTVPSFMARTAINTPIGALFNLLVDPPLANTIEPNGSATLPAPAAGAIAQGDTPTPPLWLADP